MVGDLLVVGNTGGKFQYAFSILYCIYTNMRELSRTISFVKGSGRLFLEHDDV